MDTTDLMHIILDLRDRFDVVLKALESTPGWNASQVKRSSLILSNFDGVETGIRQLIRRRPIETENFALPRGVIRAPTLAECVRIKSAAALVRNATHDYLDLAALTDRLGLASADALISMDEYYADQRGADGDRIVTQLVKQLAEPLPFDLSSVDLAEYRKFAKPCMAWSDVVSHLREIAAVTFERLNLLEND